MQEKIAMTGEISLHGRVLPVGGLKEKLLAAQREGMKSVILPSANEAYVKNLSANVKKGLKLIFVDNYEQAYGFLFPDQSKSSSNECDYPLVNKKRAGGKLSSDLAID